MPPPLSADSVGRLGFSITWVGLMTAVFAYDAHRKQKAHRQRYRLRAFRQAHNPEKLSKLFPTMPSWINFSDVEKCDFVRWQASTPMPCSMCLCQP